jgi:hypothetical protein
MSEFYGFFVGHYYFVIKCKFHDSFLSKKNVIIFLLSFALMQKKVTNLPARASACPRQAGKKSRLYKNFLFSTDRLCIACLPPVGLHLAGRRRKPRQHTALPMLLHRSLIPRNEPSLENHRNFYNVIPSLKYIILLSSLN